MICESRECFLWVVLIFAAKLTFASKVHTLTYAAKDLSLNMVTVFPDRAEVKRVFDAQLHAGHNDIIIKNTASSLASDSIRIAGLGDGVTILGVDLRRQSTTEEQPELSPELKPLIEKQKALKQKRDELTDKKSVFTKRGNSLDRMLEKLSDVALLKDQFVDLTSKVEDVFKFHLDQSTKLRSEERSLDEELKQVEAELAKLEGELSILKSHSLGSKSIVIQLDAAKAIDVAITLVYHVYDSYWTPSYDMRFDSKPGINETTNLQLTYFGVVRQNSGEDWNNTRIALSTSSPQVGGTLPKLGALYAKFRPEQEPRAEHYYGAPPPRGYGSAPYTSQMAMSYDMEAAPMRLAMKTTTAEVQQNILSTTFSVQETKTIPSGSNEHRLTIGTMSLPALFHSHVVPSKNRNVFLSASVLNNSTYPLLDGNAAVYVENAFVAKVSVKGAAVGEVFECSIGVDDSVKVLYKPTSKFDSQSAGGRITTSHQRVVVKNVKQQEVVLTLHEPIPQSTDARINVKVISPPLTEKEVDTTTKKNVSTQLYLPSPGGRINDDNNLEWTIQLAANEERELSIKWELHAPQNKTVVYNEEF